MIPYTETEVRAVNYQARLVSMRECADAAALLHLADLDEPMQHSDGDEYTLHSVVPQSTYPDPERAAMVEEEIGRLKAILRSRWSLLTEREREVMSLQLSDPDMTQREMAAALGVTVQAVSRHLVDARSTLSGGKVYVERVNRRREAAERKYKASEHRRAWFRDWLRNRRAAQRAAAQVQP